MPSVSDLPPKDQDNMPTAEQARELLIAVAGPRDLSAPSVKELLKRGADRLHIGFRRARAIYHREARLIGADEWEAMKKSAAQHNAKATWNEAEHARMAMALSEGNPLAQRPGPLSRTLAGQHGGEGHGAASEGE